MKYKVTCIHYLLYKKFFALEKALKILISSINSNIQI